MDAATDHPKRPEGRRAGISLLAAIGYVAIAAAFFSPVLLSGRLLAPGDGGLFFLPAFLAPTGLWSNANWCGFPIAADPQNMTWYPILQLFRLTGSWNGFVIAAYVVASLGMYAYVKKVTAAALPAFLAGLVYGLGGFMVSHLGHPSMIHAAAWPPLILLGLESLRDRLRPAWIALTALAIGLCLVAGHPQIFIYAMGLGGLYALVRSWDASSGPIRYLSACAFAVLLGVALGAILLLPMLELTRFSSRAAMTYDFYDIFNLRLREWPRVLFPYLYGGFWNPASGATQPSFGEYESYVEVIGFAGLLTWALAGIALHASRFRALTWFWAAVALVALLMTFGSDVEPLSVFLFRIPGYNWFRCPGRHFLEMSLGLAVLSGLGLDALARLPQKKRRQLAILAGTGLAFVLFITYGYFALTYLHRTGSGKMPIVAGHDVRLFPWLNPALGGPLLAAALGVAVLIGWSRRCSAIWSGLLIATVVLDLGTFGWFCEWRPRSAPAVLLTPSDTLLTLREHLASTNQRAFSFQPATGTPELLAGQYARLHRIPIATGDNPLAPRTLLEMTKHWDAVESNLGDESRVLDVLACRYLLLSTSQCQRYATVLASSLTSDRLAEVARTDKFVVFENKRACPRCWLVQEAREPCEEGTLATLQTGHFPDGDPFDPRKTALLASPLELELGAPDPEATATVVAETTTRVTIATSSRSASILILSDADYPGWQAAVDGAPVTIERVNHTMRGVPVPAGDHQVVFAYRSSTTRVGAIVSLAALMVVGLLLLSVGMSGWTEQNDDAMSSQ
ncbi:Bacterial membrane protein YfhO [Planctomycetes bacterium Pan216]|uniref:Bacterial membrane protein YfhO n=1 Tax=Kolteria novifilia TaxID=2527975 RepID=A0A518BD22_9BACT|nr:Bacterial membrane protein YfhO [Planctomycetes bacterium Pan216]